MGSHTESEDAKRVLVVDDDLICRAMLERGLKKLGYQTAAAESVDQARDRLTGPDATRIDCVVSDYRMPRENGVDLLRWLHDYDPTLSTIMLTGDGDKGSIAEMLREGAIDYHDKPVEFEKLEPSVEMAIARTRKRREMKATVKAVDDVGNTMSQLIGLRQLETLPCFKLCYKPMSSAGGDFVNFFTLPDGRDLVLFTDVSGHDLNAAYISSFFQGMVRGMIEKQAPIAEILEFFNRFLMKEWNTDEATDAGQDLVSLAVSTALVDRSMQNVTLTNFGCPPPIYVQADGQVLMGEDSGCPLGWFEEQQGVVEELSFADGGYLFFWSDGLDDLAQELAVSPFALAHRLLHADAAEQDELLAKAKDDNLVLRYDLENRGEAPHGPQPVFHESYGGDEAGQIDDIQALWQMSLRLALPEISEQKVFDALLCARESVLNAMEHGCRSEAERKCQVTFLFHAEEQRLQIRVEDPGEGFVAQEGDSPFSEAGMPDLHCGMILMRQLPSRVESARQGAMIRMDFDLSVKESDSGTKFLVSFADN